MTDANIWSRDEIESPCKRICLIHPDAGLCVGCLRTADEIAAWSRMTAGERRAIMAALPERETAITRRGRRGRARRRAAI